MQNPGSVLRGFWFRDLSVGSVQGYIPDMVRPIANPAVRTTGKNVCDGYKETFLTIGEEYKGFVDQGLKCMALNHSQKKLQEPDPIVVILGKGEQRTVSMNRSGSEENSYIELGISLNEYCSTLIHVC